MRKIALMLAVSLLWACGDDADDTSSNNRANNTNNTNNANNVERSFALACDDTDSEVGLHGSVYVDVEDAAESLYTHADAREPLPGVEVRLLSASGESWSTNTCDDGTFRFVTLPEETLLLDVSIDGKVTSVNDLKNYYDAVEDGEINLLVFGDSIPVYGPDPWFPSRLKNKLEALGPVELTNVAVSGTESTEWLPGTALFIGELLPNLKSADVVVFSLGGNDVLSFIASLQGDPNPAARLGEVDPLVDDIIANINAITQRITETNPDADVIWILYPNYATTDQWAEFLGQYSAAAIPLVESLLKRVRTELSERDDLILVDMLERTRGEDIDALIIDPLHLNEAGHELYASEIARTMGVIEPGSTPISYDFAVSAE